MKTIKRLSAIIFVMILSFSMAMPAFAVGRTTKMVDMHTIASDNVETRSELTDSYGKSYTSNIFAFDARKKGYVRYELNGKYESFTGNLVASTSTSSSASMMLSIFADGKEVYTISKFTKQMDAQSISVDLKGVNVLEIMSRDANDTWDAWEFITDGVFTSAENASLTYPDWDTLNNVVLVDSGNYSSTNRMQMDSYGELYHDGYSFDSRRNGYALYNLNNAYEVFSGYIWPQRNANDNMSSTIKIYANDEAIYTQSGIRNTTQAIWFELDVTNVKTLKIESYPDGNTLWDTTIYVAGTKLSKHQHTAGEPVVDKEATCTETGTQSVYCTECGALVSSETIAALGHTAETKWAITVESTCTEKGEQVQYCTVCGEAANTENIDATGHTPSGTWEYSDDGTCNKVQYCVVCGEIAEHQTDEEADHTLSGEWIITTEARCDAEGEQVQYCTVCGEIAAVEVIPTTEHDYGKWTTISGSVWNNPIIKERTCSICGDVEHVESNSTSWVKPLVIVLFIIIFGSVAVLFVTLRMNGLPLELASIKKLFSKETLSDTDIEDLINKTDDTDHKE